MEKKEVVHLQKSLFTTTKPDDKQHRCVVAFGKKHAVSYQHGSSHKRYKKNDKLVLYNVMDLKLKIEVVVSIVSETIQDFIVFESIDQDFPHYPSSANEIFIGQKYLQMVIDQKTRDPAWKEGIISKFRAGFFFGTSHGEFGDSGAGIFDEKGRFIGISIGKKEFAFSNFQISGSKMDYGEMADHHPETKIISAAVIRYGIKENPDFQPPEKKKREDELE